MGQVWHLLSYNTGRFQSVFGKASETEEAALLNMIDMEMGATPDDDIGMLAKKIAHEGINYQNLPPRQAEVVDQILSISFSQEGLWNELELEEEMPEGIDHKHIAELLRFAAGQPLEVLPVLKSGRRYKCPIGPQCHYFILERTEVPKLAQEARALVTKPDLTWSSPDVPGRLMDGLVMVCDFVAKKQKPLAGVLSQ
jgi:hypothetical protein